MDRTLEAIADHLKRRLPNLEVRRVFDVGANVGQTTTKVVQLWPGAEVWAFEPVERTHRELTEAVAGLAQVRIFNTALSGRPGSAWILSKGNSGNNTVMAEHQPHSRPVDLVPGDDFCAEHGVDHINYLKIDTEGHDLQVVRGFQAMLARHAVDVIEVEAGMNATNAKHVPYEQFKGYLEPMGYFTFQLYEQVFEFSGKPLLRRANVLFVSESAADANIVPRTKTA